MKKNNVKLVDWWSQIRNKYRFQVVEEETYKVKFVFLLSRLNVFVLVSTVFVSFFLFIFCLIAYTPIKQYVPGFAGLEESKEVIKLKIKTEKLSDEMSQKQMYLDNLLSIVNGGTGLPTKKGKQGEVISKDSIDIELNSKNITKLREEVENRDKYNVVEIIKPKQSEIEGEFFFKPCNGVLSSRFNPSEGHFGVDIAAPMNVTVKAVLDGVVVFSGFAISTGYSIILQHDNQMLSVYKHNSESLVKVGKQVKAGDVIALVGNSGEETSGPHLHFEIWLNGKSINPQDYINFD